MEFINYQNQAIRTTHYKKSPVIVNIEIKDQMLNDIGDLLYGMTVLCYDLDTTLETVALRNLAKLRKRQRANSGDDR